jgi:VanZ family protein
MSDAAWSAWYRRALPAYWFFVFCCTHFPDLRLDLGVPSSDKLAHAAAFALLAFLFWRFAETFRRPLPATFVWWAAAVLAGYAAFDELTQSFVGRRVDIRDWLGGVAGMATVLGVLEWQRRRRVAS